MYQLSPVLACEPQEAVVHAEGPGIREAPAFECIHECVSKHIGFKLDLEGA